MKEKREVRRFAGRSEHVAISNVSDRKQEEQM